MPYSTLDPWKFEFITSWESVFSPEFQNRWLKFVNEAVNSHPFFHPSVSAAWLKTYRPLRHLQPLFIVAKSSDMEVFLPLVLWTRDYKHLWCKLLIPVGYSDYDYCEPLVVGKSSELNWSAIWDVLLGALSTQVAASVDKIIIPGIRGGAEGRVGVNIGEPCAYLDLFSVATSGDVLDFLKPSHKRPLERRLRRLTELGEISLHVYSQSDPHEAEKALEVFLAHHRKRWPNAYKAPHFHTNLLHAALETGLLHFSELRVGVNRPLCWQLSLVWQRTYYAYQIAFDPEFAKFSPGQVCLLFCLRDAKSKGFQNFDHLRGDEAYKSGWATGKRELFDVTLAGSRPLATARHYLACILRRVGSPKVDAVTPPSAV